MTEDEIRELGRYIGRFTVAIAPINDPKRLDSEHQEEMRKQGRRTYDTAGGTIVRFEERLFILTAAHVWRGMVDADYKVLIYKSATAAAHLGGGSPHPAARDLWPAPIRLGPPSTSTAEWGPDLALLPLPRQLADELLLAGAMAAYTMELHEKPIEGDWCAVAGGPAAVATPLETRMLVTVGTVQARREIDNFDYHDVPFFRSRQTHEELRSLPRWEGMSGSGLWHLDFDERSKKWRGRANLVGVAWRDVLIDDDRMDIRCHGPRSLNRLFEMQRRQTAPTPSGGTTR